MTCSTSSPRALRDTLLGQKDHHTTLLLMFLDRFVSFKVFEKFSVLPKDSPWPIISCVCLSVVLFASYVTDLFLLGHAAFC